MSLTADFIVVGAGSAGCIAAAELARREAGSVLLIEAGPTDRSPLVKMPFGLISYDGRSVGGRQSLELEVWGAEVHARPPGF